MNAPAALKVPQPAPIETCSLFLEIIRKSPGIVGIINRIRNLRMFHDFSLLSKNNTSIKTFEIKCEKDSCKNIPVNILQYSFSSFNLLY